MSIGSSSGLKERCSSETVPELIGLPWKGNRVPRKHTNANRCTYGLPMDGISHREPETHGTDARLSRSSLICVAFIKADL